jgi:FkbM family methyltransferase
LIFHYFDRVSTSVYPEEHVYSLVREGEVLETDPTQPIQRFRTRNGAEYRVLKDASKSFLSDEFRKYLAKTDEVFFVKTHELPFGKYFEGEYVIRIVRHPGAALWSYQHYLRDLDQVETTLDDVITGVVTGNNWTKYTNAWLEAGQKLGENYFRVTYEDLVASEAALIEKVKEWTGFPILMPAGSFPAFEEIRKKRISKLFRSGKVDEWKSKLTPEQIMLVYQLHAVSAAKEGYTFDFPPPPYPVDYETRTHLAQLGMVDVKTIPKVEDAGRIVETDSQRYQIMFNGVKVPADSYYGPWYSELIRQCKGHHEPQEEYVFDAIVKHAPEGATMIELGSYWAFYSTWFLTHVPQSKAILVEPSPNNLLVSMATLSLNDVHADVVLAAMGDLTELDRAVTVGGAQAPNFTIPQETVDALMTSRGLEHLYVLHSDIQGAEVAMLEGAAQALSNQRIDYLVISTHSKDIHHECMSKLSDYNYRIIAEHDPFESFTFDGLIVACAKHIQDLQGVKIRKRTIADWTWEDAAGRWANKALYLEQHNQMLAESIAAHGVQNVPMSQPYPQIMQFAEGDLTLREENQRLQQKLAALESAFDEHLDELRRRKISRLMAFLGKPII